MRKTLKIILTLLLLLLLIMSLGFYLLKRNINFEKINFTTNDPNLTIKTTGKIGFAFTPRLAISFPLLQIVFKNSQNTIELKEFHIPLSIFIWPQSSKSLQVPITAKALHYRRLILHDLTMELILAEESVKLNHIQANLYKGKLKGWVLGQNLNKKAIWRGEVTLSDVALEPFLQATLRKKPKISLSGRLHLIASGETFGQTQQERIRNLTSQADIEIKQGLVHGFDGLYLIEKANVLLNKKNVAPIQHHYTAFDLLTAKIKIEQGIATTDSLYLLNDLFAMLGSGSLNLNNVTIDLTLKINPQDTVLKKMLGQHMIPVVVTGSLQNPQVRLNDFKLQQIELKKQIDKVKQKARDKINKHFSGDTAKWLQHLLK